MRFGLCHLRSTITDISLTYPAAADSREMMYLAYLAAGHLHRRGDYQTALAIAENLFQQWRRRFGDDDRHVLFIAQNIVYTYRGLGRYEEALILDEDSLPRFRRTLGEDHKDALTPLTTSLWTYAV